MSPQIIGICMVKNEDVWIAPALRSALPLVDRIHVIDTGSTDNTLAEIDSVRNETPKPIEVYHEDNLRRTHEYVEKYCGTQTWIFGIDGDEINDATRMRDMRRKIRAGHYSTAFQVKGMYLHVTKMYDHYVQGHLGPPSHNPTKLYNFANIPHWPCDYEHILFQSRERKTRGTIVQTLKPWAAAEMRCLHMRFMQRSSSEPSEIIGRRLHGEDIIGNGSRRDRGGRDDVNERLAYRRGDIVTMDIDNWRIVDGEEEA